MTKTKERDLFTICEQECSTLHRLLNDIGSCARALQFVTNEAIVRSGEELENLQKTNKSVPFEKTVQLTPLAHASMEELLALISEYNTRLLWRKAVLEKLSK